MTAFIAQPPRMTITWEVLEAAKDAGDEMMIATCRRVIVANRLGWRKHRTPGDLTRIYAFADALRS